MNSQIFWAALVIETLENEAVYIRPLAAIIFS
jgi:hypothetical protein